MKKTVAFFLSLSLLALAACHKDHVTGLGTTTTTDTLGTLKINLISAIGSLPDTATTSIELVISEPGGKVLLDTITPEYTHITTSLSTNATTVDLTTVVYNSLLTTYFATTYKSVNPSNWAGDYSLGYYNPTGPGPAVMLPDTLTFTNVPSISAIFFSQNIFTGLNEDLTIPNTIIEKYSMVPGNYAYLLCATVGSYKMVIPNQSNETVDCSTMDQALSASFTPSSYFGFFSSFLLGYPDSTNLNSEILMYQNYAPEHLNIPQLEYPTKNIQKYALTAQFSHGNNEFVEVYSYSNTINTNITYPDPNSYTLGAMQNTQFTLGWNGAKPTYYSTSWRDSTVSWTIYASPDSTTLNPIGLWTAQKPKMLQGQDLTKLALGEFQFETVSGYNYAGYLGLTTNSSQLSKNPVSGGVAYYKNF
jgi:hypothetical protein